LSERVARLLLGLVVAGLTAGAFFVRIPHFWADGATYHAMAWSLAEDGDLRYDYDARDIFRIRREIPSGPQGIFLKRASGGLRLRGPDGSFGLGRVSDPQIYYAKAFLYPLVAAPFVKLLGTRGLFLINALSLALALVLGYSELRRRAGPALSLALALALILGTVAPLYLLWPQPELFNLGLVAAGLVAWRRSRPLLSAVLLGLATYSKPYNLFLALPLGLEPLLVREGRPFLRGLGESVRRGLVLAATTAALFGLNKAITGELNYQGGERKTFYGVFPYETHGVTFGNSGEWMTTDRLGPLVEGKDEAALSRRTGPLRPAEEIRRSFIRNLGYFWIGRFGGAFPYFPGAVLALIVFMFPMFPGPRETAGWLALAALVVSFLFYIWMIPDNWYGGGGAVGNRYFLNLLPLSLFLVPRGRELLVAAGGILAGALFLHGIWRHPLQHSLRPGDHAMRLPFRVLPPELTMLNDLSVFTEAWRKKRPFGDTEGDPHRHWPADPTSYYLYFLDNGSYGKEDSREGEGFWLRGGKGGEVVLRALEPIRRLSLHLSGGPDGDLVSVSMGGRAQTLSVGPGEEEMMTFEPGRGFPYYDTFLHLLRFRSRAAVTGSDAAARPLGAFVRIVLDVDRRQRQPSARLLLAEEGIQAPADLQAALPGVGLQQLLAGGGRDGKVLAGQVDPGDGLPRAVLLIEEGAQLGVGVEVAGQGFDRRAPFLARVSLIQQLRFRDEGIRSHQVDRAGAP